MADNEKRDSPGSSTLDSPHRNDKKASVGGYGAEDAVPRDHLNAMFENPLAGIPRDQLFSDVEEFCNRWGLESYIETFKKGALVAQNPSDTPNLDILTPEDKEHFMREHTHKWSQTFDLYWLVSKYFLLSSFTERSKD